jgi:hydroxyacylglutathione hydrolase
MRGTMGHVEILDNLFLIERGFLNGNHFLYRSNTPILIDTGYGSDLEMTERLLRDLGVDLSYTRLIINTHTHSDHIGGNKAIQQRSGCHIALHSIGKHFIDTKDDWSTWWRYYGHESEFFECTHALEDGERVGVGPHEFRVLHTPGHASDGIVLYHPKEKILISSDTLWENDVATITTRVEGSTTLFRLLESLERLESLEVKVVYPGHGGPFKDFESALKKSRKKVIDYLNHPEKTGSDLLKKIIIYTLLMLKETDEAGFFGYLMGTHWFKETVELYFNRQYRLMYDKIMNDFLRRSIVKRLKGKLYTTVRR